MILPCIAQTHSQKQEDLDNHGHRLHVTLYLPSTPDSASQPTIVFESGLGNDGDIWSAVIAQLPSNLRLVTYDRPSLGLSEPDGQLPTEEHCAEVLHEALKKVATPPFLLVGHSWGGPRLRAFAGMYPAEVAGLVFVDPTDFTMTVDQLKKEVFAPLGHADDGQALFLNFLERAAQKASAAVQAERRVFIESELNEYGALRRLPMPDVPLVVLIAELSQPLPPDLNFPFDQKKFDSLLLTYRLNSLTAFSRTVSEGTLVATPNSAHYIQIYEPQLVAWAIERVLHPDIRRRLLTAFERGQLSAMRTQLTLIKQGYPPNLMTEESLNTIGYLFLESGEKRAAQGLFTLIRQDYPNSSNAYDSLAEAEAANGDKTSALRDYQRSLELNPKNENARNRIKLLTSKPD